MSLRDHGARPHLVLAIFLEEHMGHGEKNVGLTDTRSPGNEPLLVRFGLPKERSSATGSNGPCGATLHHHGSRH